MKPKHVAIGAILVIGGIFIGTAQGYLFFHGVAPTPTPKFVSPIPTKDIVSPTASPSATPTTPLYRYTPKTSSNSAVRTYPV